MSRDMARSPSESIGFPRVSGDEPALNALAPADRKFSPRERG